ncbi:MAG TPA: biotin--protein ligase [Cyanothece sp. UBA12306]|nr:biotin--protein ligase [Cyanothece sp. UBA12306]
MNWRLIPPIKASGEVQMAIDNWLFSQHEKGNHRPTLRFYTWSSATISLGRLQKKCPEYWYNITWDKKPLDLVHRSTGGRAVLHQGDLTYSVINSLDNRKTLEIYQDICQFLIKGWLSLGIQLDYGTAKRGYINNPSCFNTATVADLITPDGSKLIGSAQRRGKRSILQHGSMVFNTDKSLFETIFKQPAPWNLSLKKQLSKNYSLETIINVLTEAAKTHFDIELVTKSISKNEWQEINKKYLDK